MSQFDFGDYDLSSDAMSDNLSVLSRTPSPPREFGLPTPPLSDHSSNGSPSPCFNASMTDSDGPPPAKRRRLSPSMPRETTRLDLHDNDIQLQQGQIDHLVKALRNKRKIVVVAGAGISVSAGIPDFRSSTGLFNSVKSQYNLKASGKQLFDASVYRDADSTASFHDMIRTLHQSTKTASPTPFHHLLARLSKEGRLLRLYTQNVDGIDTSMTPLATEIPLPRKGPWPKTVQLHGGLAKMTCTKCHEITDFAPEEFDGPIPPECPECAARDFARTEVAGKRSHGIGRLRPRMVLYHEHNPDDEAIGSVTRADLRTRPDAVIVVGTTLKVPGVRRIVREMCATVRDRRDGFTAWINNDPEPSGKEFEDSWDMIIKGTSDEVARLAALPQWDEPEMVTAVSEAEEAELMCSSQVSVVVPLTPAKTPRSTSQPMAQTQPIPSVEMDAWKQGTSAKGKTTKKKEAATTTKPVPKEKEVTTKKPAAKEKKPPGKKAPTTKKIVAANSTIPFKVAKPVKVVPVGKGKVSDSVAAKAEPLVTSSKRNSQSPPEKTGIKLKLTPKQITATS